MASITRYTTAKGETRWRVQYRKPDRHLSQKRGFKTKRDASIWAASVETSVRDGSYVDPTAGRAKLEDLGEAWLRRQSDWKESYRYTMRSTWETHVKPRWGRVPVADVTRTDVEEWAAGVDRSRSVLSRCVTILNGILDDAVSDRLIPSNRVGKVVLPRAEPKRRQYLTHAQVEAFAAAAGERGVIIRTLAYTGLRWGELAGLHAEDVNVLGRRIRVERNAVQVGSRIVVGSPKTHERRTVPVPGFLADELGKVLRPGIVFPAADGGYQRSPRASDTKRSWWRTACLDAGLPVVTPHELRHTAASLAVQAGAHVKTLQRMLGHKSAAMTLDVYSDLFDGDLDTVATALDEARTAALG